MTWYDISHGIDTQVYLAKLVSAQSRPFSWKILGILLVGSHEGPEGPEEGMGDLDIDSPGTGGPFNRESVFASFWSIKITRRGGASARMHFKGLKGWWKPNCL